MSNEVLTIVNTVVSPNGPGGCNGPPIEEGIVSVRRVGPGGVLVTRTFGEPRRDLLGVNWDQLTDDEIASLP